MPVAKQLVAVAREARSHVRTVGRAAVNQNGARKIAIRWYAFGAIRRLTPSVAVVHDGAWYYVSTNDNLIGRHTFSTGSYEQDLFAKSLDIIETLTGSPPLRGRTLIDVGANIGTTTIPAIAVFGASLVLAFEPAPANFKLLRCNVIANDVEDIVRASQLALSDHSGVASLEMSDSNWGDHRIRAADVRQDLDAHGESRRTMVDVPVARLDDVLLEGDVDLDRLGLLWMDTQGHEGHVLAGAEAALAHGVATVLEYWPYALARAGGLERLYRLVASHYRWVVDLRASVRGNETVKYPAGRLPDLERVYAGDHYTDLILLP